MVQPDTPTDTTARTALVDAIDWFHTQLSRDLPEDSDYDTPRQYFRQARGWTDDTIDQNRLGYAPPDTRDKLLATLHRRGHDRDAILATGLFAESNDGSLYAIWTGRYVLPYLDAEGDPVFAISRALEPHHPRDWAGKHGEDDDPAKYHKLPVSRDDVPLEEPIYGLDSIQDGQPVLITEGIADAITAHQAGYPCLSPVTTAFKHDDRQRLLDVLDEHDVDRAYLVQDAERPGSTLDDQDRLTLPQTGEGLQGAVSTAQFLAEHGIDARIGHLPRPGLDKVDLDDFLTHWNADLTPVLAAATPIRQHPAYDPQQAALDAADHTHPQRQADTASSDTNTSALFELDIRQVTGCNWDYRGVNPLGHHGNSEQYFVLLEDRGLAYDHKYKAAYNPLTYLLVDAGERPPSSPNGPLDDTELYAAWTHAKDQRLILEDDPVPHRALRAVALDTGLCEREDIEDGWRLPPDAYNAAIDAIREDGYDPGRGTIQEPDSDADANLDDQLPDPLDLEVVYEPRRAWRAASDITPDDLDEPLGLEITDDGNAWRCPDTGERIGDIVRATAIEHGQAHDRETATDLDAITYCDCYTRAREDHGAPLPVYVDATVTVDEFDAAQAAAEHLKCWHIIDNLDSEITVDDPAGEAIAKIDPTWEDSDSGERILAFNSGLFWCTEHDRVIDPLRVVALEHGLLVDEGGILRGQDYLDAYELARTAYDAPLPEVSWLDSDRTPDPDHEVVLPPAEKLLGEFTTDRDALEAARERNEALYRQCAKDRHSADLLTSLPALGKSTSAVKTARDVPTLALAPRRELQQEYRDKANRFGLTSYFLPVFAEPWEGVSDEALEKARELVRQDGFDRLRDPEALLQAVDATVEPSPPGEETVILDRATCETAAGEHGHAWALAVGVAHSMGLTPHVIHENAPYLFGDELPCCREHDHDGDGAGDADATGDDAHPCPYSRAWERVADPDRPIDLLIGSRVHGHVESARTWYGRTEDGRVDLRPRTVVLDEFPGDDYGTEWGEDAPRIATWLASALVDEIDDQTDLQRSADLLADAWVWDWLAGNGQDVLAPLARRAEAAQALLEASQQLAALREDDRSPAIDSLLATLRDGQLTDPQALATRLDAARSTLPEALPARLVDAVADPLQRAATALDAIEDAHDLADPALDVTPSLGAGLRSLVDEGLAVFEDGVDPDALDAQLAAAATAQTVITGGEEAVSELVVRAKHPYAHPDAHLLLAGMIADGEDTTLLELEYYGFDPDRDRTRVSRVEFNGATILWDRNGAGAYVLDPPTFRSQGQRCSVVGLDATGRSPLWNRAIGEDMTARDIHDTPTERRQFLRDVLNVQVIRTEDVHVNTYSGSPAGNNLDDDRALLEAIATKFGEEEGQFRRNSLATADKPGLITTKAVLDAVGDQFDPYVSATEHYWNFVGSNAMSGCNLGVMLGAPHPGHEVVERWAALAGEEIDIEGHGMDLDYNSPFANSYLQYAREDQIMQGILRFGRDQEGAVVFAHTAALREDLPVVGTGAVTTAYSEAGKAVRDAMLPYLEDAETFTVADLEAELSVSRRTIQRKLEEFEQLGYLDRVVTGPGRANVFDPIDDPGVGHADLPAVEGAPPDETRIQTEYTGTVGMFVQDQDSPPRCDRRTGPRPRMPPVGSVFPDMSSG